MAELMLESFDHCSYADLISKWTQSYSLPSISPTLSTSAGRRSTTGLRFATSGSQETRPLAVTLAPSGTTCIVGFAFNQSAGAFSALTVAGNADPNLTGGSSNRNGLLYIRQGGTNQIVLSLNQNGTFDVIRGTAPYTLLGQTTNALTSGVFAYIELQVLISNTVGTVSLYVNGASWLSLTGQDTQATASASWDEVAIGYLRGSSCTWDFDDLYIADGSGSGWTAAKQRDIRVDATFPNAAGNSSQFTRSTGADQYATIDETSANSDTDYNSSSTVNDTDTLNFPTAPVAGADIYGVQVVCQVKKTDAGAAEHKASTRISGTDYLGTAQSISTSYAFLRQCWDLKPSDSTAWTESDYNAAEFGYAKST